VRDLWRWPLYSWRRLVGILAAAAVALIAYAVISGGGEDGGSGGSGGSESRATPTGSAPASSPAASDDASPGMTTDDYQAAAAAAQQFVAAWASHPRSHADWMDAMDPYMGPTFANQMRTGLPDNVDATKVTGKPRIVLRGVPGRTQVVVPTDAGPYSVDLGRNDLGEWLATDIRPGAQAAE
jgi:hypothetical protein